MKRVCNIFSYLCEIAPLELKLPGDNVGLLVGDSRSPVSKVVVALDITSEVIEEAAEYGAELIVSHHPVIFSPLSSVVESDPTGKKIISLVKNGISAICMHTNLDIVCGGVNDILAKRVGLRDIEILCDPALSVGCDTGVCRVGMLSQPIDFAEYAAEVKNSLGAAGIWYVPSGKKTHKVAVGGGACGGDIELVAGAGCDTFITSDIKHSQALLAKELGLNIIDAGHFYTEDLICPAIVDSLSAKFPGIEVKKSDRNGCIKTFLSKEN